MDTNEHEAAARTLRRRPPSVLLSLAPVRPGWRAAPCSKFRWRAVLRHRRREFNSRMKAQRGVASPRQRTAPGGRPLPCCCRFQSRVTPATAAPHWSLSNGSLVILTGGFSVCGLRALRDRIWGGTIAAHVRRTTRQIGLVPPEKLQGNGSEPCWTSDGSGPHFLPCRLTPLRNPLSIREANHVTRRRTSLV